MVKQKELLTELRSKSPQELEEQVRQLKEEMADHTVKRYFKDESEVQKVRELKQTLSRALTVLQEMKNKE